MSFHKLHIFAKNRDVVTTQKVYTYQQLKTVEDCIGNTIADGDEEIYAIIKMTFLPKITSLYIAETYYEIYSTQ